MIAAVASGRLRSSRWSWVTKSAPIFSATSFARSGFFSASPIQSTCAWRAAISPRISPMRPAPTMARPMRFGCFLGIGGNQAAARRAAAGSGRSTGALRPAERSAAMYTSITMRACSGVTSTGRSSATASRKWTVSAAIGPA